MRALRDQGKATLPRSCGHTLCMITGTFAFGLLVFFFLVMYSHSLLGDAKQKLCRKALLASLQQRRALSSIGLRRENKSRWERRAPLTPEAVKKLIQETGTRVYVESSTKRIFSDKAYAEVSIFICTNAPRFCLYCRAPGIHTFYI